MATRPFRIVTGLTGLLIATGASSLLSEQGDGWVGSAYAQDAESWDEEAEAGSADESSAEADEEVDDGESMEESTSTEDDPGAEEEESEPVAESDDSAATESADEAPSDELVAEEPAEPESAPEPAAEAPSAPSPQQAQPSQPVSREERVRQVLFAAIRDVVPALGAHAFADSDSLVDLGANSVDRAEIAMLAQERLGLNVPRVELFGPKNLGEMIALLASKMP